MLTVLAQGSIIFLRSFDTKQNDDYSFICLSVLSFGSTHGFTLFLESGEREGTLDCKLQWYPKFYLHVILSLGTFIEFWFHFGRIYTFQPIIVPLWFRYGYKNCLIRLPSFVYKSQLILSNELPVIYWICWSTKLTTSGTQGRTLFCRGGGVGRLISAALELVLSHTETYFHE